MHRTILVPRILALILALEGAAGAQEPPSLSASRAVGGDTLTLSLADAQRLAVERSPGFLARAEEAEIARGELRRARVLRFNPELELEVPGAVTNGAVREYEASLTQRVEYGGQRGLRIDAARAGLERARHDVADAARAAVAEAAAVFYAALAAERRLIVTEVVLALTERLREATHVQLREGEISAMEANLVGIELGRARARVLTARRELTSVHLELKRRLGLAPEREIRLVARVPETPPPGSLDRDALIALALARRPDLSAWTAAVEERRSLQRLAAREALPELRLGLLVERETASSLVDDGAVGPVLGEPPLRESAIGFGVSLSLPLWDRNQGVQAQRAARARQAALQRAEVELQIRTEVSDAYHAYLAATEAVEIFERDVLRSARENQALLHTAYRAGKIDLPNLILLRNQLLEAELGYWDAWLAQRIALVELQAATADLGASDGAYPPRAR